MGQRYTVVFDLGGVLVQINPSLAAACRAAGVPERDVVKSPVVISAWETLDMAHQIGQIGTDEFLSRMTQLLEERYSEDEVARIHRHCLGAEYPGVAVLIDELHSKFIPTGVLSNTNPSHWNVLQGAGYQALAALMARFPERVLASHLLGSRKPDPAIYRAYVAQAAVDPSELVFFDDSVSNVEAARAQGWNAFAIDPSGDTAAQMRSLLGQLS